MAVNRSTDASHPAWLKTLTGTRIRIKTPGVDTENRLTVIEYVEPPRSTPPVFTRHEFVEVFCVLDGTLTFQFLDEQRFEIGAGESVTCTSWKPHSFWNETDQPVTALLICTPSGLDEFFTESDQLLSNARDSDAGEHDDLQAAMKALRVRFGLEHVGVPPYG